MKGLILFGANNIFAVVPWEAGQAIAEDEHGAPANLRFCRIKGKILIASGTREHNPLAAGDHVEFEPGVGNEGMIISRLPRKNRFFRWNSKTHKIQTLAANLDAAVCVVSAEQPPFRPRFIDRFLLYASLGEVRPFIILNKTDFGVPDEIGERVDSYQKMGVTVVRCSATSGEGLDEIKKIVKERISVFIGQSGVGKSTLVNALSPTLSQKTGAVSAKFDRGNHTTCLAIYLPWDLGPGIVDTPGFRELEIDGIPHADLAWFFTDFEPFIASCRQPGCLHEDEKQCAVREAAENGAIHPDRYESYLRILYDLKEKPFHGRNE